ncbi:RDD family protein [Marinoscillum furvescens]|uniref:Putative RDD family membrane protein YckC n=1 Tax=Marinoscillum furvescens DSM 4134 TaxID=1122208 RepID=A0A3D9L645_MARFU|nr:RDD family protein [Marinoscillum furvescens]REE00067.1 putative RDD family membrane protein YckC [Marinoscillum furvescens DSM 4134]
MTYAGFWPRLMAHNIDLLILLPCYYLLSFGIDSNRWLFVACSVFTLLYEILFVSSKWNATPGKRWMKLKVVDQHGQPPSPWRCAARTLIKIVSALTFFIGFLVVALHPAKRGLHDLFSNTFVIFVKND